MTSLNDAFKELGSKGNNELPEAIEYYVDFYRNIPDFDDLQGWDNIISKTVKQYINDIEKIDVILALKPSSLDTVIDYSDYTDFKKLIHDMLSWAKREGVEIE